MNAAFETYTQTDREKKKSKSNIWRMLARMVRETWKKEKSIENIVYYKQNNNDDGKM